MEQNHIPEKQQELNIHGRCCQCNGSDPSVQIGCPEADPWMRPAAFAVGKSPSASPGRWGGPAAGEGSARWSGAVESGICEHVCSQNHSRKIMGLKGGEGKEEENLFSRPVLFSLQENSVNSLNF